MLGTGQTFGGYEIEDYAGSGGMGVVYRARDQRLGRLVALKVIAPHLARDRLVRQRLNRESQILASVDHPNVLPIYDAGEAEGSLYLASRWVEGRTLSDIVAEDGPLTPGAAVRIIGQVASALAAAHRIGLVHRDVKPSNILVADDGHVYLADFGLARHTSDGGGLTNTEQLLGTLDYVPPEQIRGEEVDQRGDIYSLGGVLFFALTGRVPFEHEAHAAKLYAHLSADRPRPSASRTDLSPEFDAIVLRALAADPDERQQSAREFERELNGMPIADGDGARPREFTNPDSEEYVLPTPSSNGHHPREPAFADPVPPAPRGRRGLAIAAAVLLAALIPAVLLLYFVNDTSAGPETLKPARSASGVTVGGGRVWIADPKAQQLVGIPVADASGKPVHIRVNMTPAQIAGDGRQIAVAGTRTLVTTLAAHPERGRRTQLPLASGALAVGPAAWIAGAGTRGLVRLGPGGRLSRSQMSSPAGGLAVQGAAVWITHPSQGTVGRLSGPARTGQLLTRLGGKPTAIAVAGGAVWVADPKRNVVERLDPATGKATQPATSVPGGPIAIAADARQVWVLRRADHAVTLIDAHTGRPLKEYGVPAGPVGVALSPGAVWIVSGGGQLTRIPR